MAHFRIKPPKCFRTLCGAMHTLLRGGSERGCPINYKAVLKRLSVVATVFPAFLIPPLIAALLCFERADVAAFLITALFSLSCGLSLGWIKAEKSIPTLFETCLLAVLSFAFMSLFGALPYTLSGFFPNFLDSLFESVSGFSSVGITAVSDLSHIHRSLLLWRAMTGWIGGLGFLLFLITVSLDCRGALEMPGELREGGYSSSGPLIRIAAAYYTAATLLEMIPLLLCGLPFGDAVAVSFSSAGCCGFLPISDPAGIAVYGTAASLIVSFFRLLHGVSPFLFLFLSQKKPRKVHSDGEFRFYLGAAVLFFLLFLPAFDAESIANMGISLPAAALLTSSTAFSSTGFFPAAASALNPFGKILLVFAVICGGSCFSLCGGIGAKHVFSLLKTFLTFLRPGTEKLLLLLRDIRFDLRTAKPGKPALKKSINGSFYINKADPNEVFPREPIHLPTIYKEPSGDEKAEALRSLILFALLTAFFSVLLLPAGRGIVVAVTASLSCITGIGPGLGISDFSSLHNYAKLVLTAAMFLGRFSVTTLILNVFFPKNAVPSEPEKFSGQTEAPKPTEVPEQTEKPEQAQN